MKITLELDTAQAAGLKRFAEKVTHSDALAVLYPHRPQALRDEQASQIMEAFYALEKALGEAKITSWPWIESGTP